MKTVSILLKGKSSSVNLTKKEIKLIIEGLDSINNCHYENKQKHIDIRNLIEKINEVAK